MPVFQHLADACGYACPFSDAVASIPDALLRRVAGNALHPAVLGAVLLTCWGNLKAGREGEGSESSEVE